MLSFVLCLLSFQSHRRKQQSYFCLFRGHKLEKTFRLQGGGGCSRRREEDRSSVDGAWVAAAAVHIQVRHVHPLLPGARLGAAEAAAAGGRRRVLPGGLAMSMPRPPLRAVTATASSYYSSLRSGVYKIEIEDINHSVFILCRINVYIHSV